jgi:hypothetical protein
MTSVVFLVVLEFLRGYVNFWYACEDVAIECLSSKASVKSFDVADLNCLPDWMNCNSI